jgi:uncharacterized protein (TIGR04141 family)
MRGLPKDSNGAQMPRKSKSQRLNIFLLKEHVGIDQVLSEEHSHLRAYNLIDTLPFSGEIRVKPSDSHPPSWLSFLQSGTRSIIEGLSSQSPSSLLSILVDGRVFCIAYGSARHWISEENIERRFGMLVTLNSVHYKKIRSVDREEFDTITKMTRSQTSVSSSIDNFGLNIQRDLVRSVTGEPEDATFALHVTGADNLILHGPVLFENIHEKCRETFLLFQKTSYKDRYPWIDNFQRVRDKSTIDNLEDELSEIIRNGALENVFLTPPNLGDTQEQYEFRYPTRKISHPDLRLDDFLQDRNREELTVEWLKKHHIREYINGGSEPSRKFSVFDALIYETRRENKLFALSHGEWFEIDQDYVDQVTAELDLIPEHQDLDLPSAGIGEKEAAYLERVAAAANGTIELLDQKNVQYGGGHSSIEICDLVTTDRNFIHVKAKTKSSTLSHLFSQGLVSAQVLREVKFRQLASEKCTTHNHIFDVEDFKPSDHAVTYAIITGATDDIKDALPFFSKQSLANAARELRNMQYGVYIKKIPIVAQ